MTTFKDFIKQHLNIDMPDGDIGMEWFEKNRLPMVVECTHCGVSLAAPNAMVDDNRYICCKECVGLK